MAQTKRKRSSKHRGNAAGTIEARGRTGRKPTPEEQKKADEGRAARARAERLAQPPTWNRATLRAAAASGLLFVLTQIGLFQDDVPLGQAIGVCLVAMLIYIPLGYVFDSWMYKRMNRPKTPKPRTDARGRPRLHRRPRGRELLLRRARRRRRGRSSSTPARRPTA